VTRLVVTPLAAGEVTRQATGRIVVGTRGQGFTELTEALRAFVAESGIGTGLATIFCRHTSASLLIGENADPDVQIDLLAALDHLAPRHAGYVHSAEGPDDMPGHIRAMLTGASLGVPIVEGRLALGTWQGVFLAEHRDAPHRREIVVHLTGG
jgi:secondary thiamine-phosphate synthase enzyme